MHDQEAAGYLAAMIDGEGSVSCDLHKRGMNRTVVIYNTDPSIIAATCEACVDLGIEYKVRGPYPNQVCTSVRIYGQHNFKRLLARVPVKCEKKHGKLVDIVASYQRKPRPTEACI